MQFSRTSPECIRCVYRYYPINGVCVKVPNECSTYDQETGECSACYTGFYLNKEGKCEPTDPLCLKTNRDGKCEKCYKNYALKNNACYYTGNSLEIEDYHDDPLCMHWDGDYC